MSYTPFAAPILSGLLADSEITKLFSIKEEVETMIGIEGALALSLAKAGLIPEAAVQAILNGFADFEPSLSHLTDATARDGVVVPELVRQLRDHVGEPHNAHIHFSATSQDIIDTALILRLKTVIKIYENRLTQIINLLDELKSAHGQNQLVARTRMQAAMTIQVADRIENWSSPLKSALKKLEEMKPNLLVLQFGGAIGTLDKLGDKAGEVSKHLANDLKLELPARPWHTDRSALVEFAGWMSTVTGALGKIGQDILLMAQNEIFEIKLSGGGGSSAMAHKQNPVGAEMLVTLSRFNAVQVSGMHHAQIHEQERSGAAWTLEWMLLPQICVATGASTRTALSLLANVEWIGGKA